jgi:hypothetical protein
LSRRFWRVVLVALSLLVLLVSCYGYLTGVVYSPTTVVARVRPRSRATASDHASHQRQA